MAGLEDVQGILKNEGATDQVLDKASELLNQATGGKFADQIEQGRDFVDSKLGDEGAATTTEGEAQA